MPVWESVLGLDVPPPAKNGGGLLDTQAMFSKSRVLK